MKITVTKEASLHFSRMLKKRGSGLGIRIGVKDSGCAQYSYVIDFVDSIGLDDEIFDQNEIKVFVSKSFLKVLDGTVIDYVPQGISKMLVFKNPNAINECGCGESFNIKD